MGNTQMVVDDRRDSGDTQIDSAKGIKRGRDNFENMGDMGYMQMDDSRDIDVMDDMAPKKIGRHQLQLGNTAVSPRLQEYAFQTGYPVESFTTPPPRARQTGYSRPCILNLECLEELNKYITKLNGILLSEGVAIVLPDIKIDRACLDDSYLKGEYTINLNKSLAELANFLDNPENDFGSLKGGSGLGQKDQKGGFISNIGVYSFMIKLSKFMRRMIACNLLANSLISSQKVLFVLCSKLLGATVSVASATAPLAADAAMLAAQGPSVLTVVGAAIPQSVLLGAGILLLLECYNLTKRGRKMTDTELSDLEDKIKRQRRSPRRKI